MWPTKKKGMRGIGNLGAMKGYVPVQVPFFILKTTKYISFAVMKGSFPSLLSNNDMITKDYYISIQGGHLHAVPFRQHLTLENYFSQHKWSTPYLPHRTQISQNPHQIWPPLRKIQVPLVSKGIGEKPGNFFKRGWVKFKNDSNICPKHAAHPRIFLLTIGMEELLISHHMVLDTPFI